MEKEGSGDVGGSGWVVIDAVGGAGAAVCAFAQGRGTSRHITSTSPITIISFFFTVASYMLSVA